MKHIGRVLKKHIESAGLKKNEVAAAAGISHNYLSAVFNKRTIDALLLERLYVAAGLNPGIVFDAQPSSYKNCSDISSLSVFGASTIAIGDTESLLIKLEEKDKLLEEKERTIKILMAQLGMSNPEQNRNNNIK